MSDELERLSQVLDDLAAEHDPALRHELSTDELELLRTAALLKAASPEASEPRSEFIEQLGAKLASGTVPAQPPSPAAKPRRKFSRRTILGQTAAAVAGAAVGVGGGAAAAYQRGKQDGYRDKETAPLTADLVPADRGTWMDTGHTVATLAPGEAKRFRAGAVEGFVVNPGHGRAIYALSAACTHMGCAITWLNTAGTFLCPCHGAQYNADGTVLSGIARHPLPSLWLRQDERGRLLVWSVPEHPTITTLAPYNQA